MYKTSYYSVSRDCYDSDTFKSLLSPLMKHLISFYILPESTNLTAKLTGQCQTQRVLCQRRWSVTTSQTKGQLFSVQRWKLPWAWPRPAEHPPAGILSHNYKCLMKNNRKTEREKGRKKENQVKKKLSIRDVQRCTVCWQARACLEPSKHPSGQRQLP